MSYLVYLNNYNIRQCRAQYLWVLYEALAHDLDARFILSKEYLRKYNKYNSWEVRQAEAKYGDFEELISRLKIENCFIMDKPENLIDTSKMVPSEILEYVVHEEVPTQVSIIEKVLKSNSIKAGVTWVNNKCFKETLHKHNIPVIHHELGPFRPNIYIPTVYVDFSGVNGETEFNKRFKEFLKVTHKVPLLRKEELIQVVSPKFANRLLDVLHEPRRMYDIGVGLQVEVDTNLLLFNKGRNWMDPVLRAQMDSDTKVLVRPHPAAGYQMKPSVRLEIDDITKGDSIDFINKCDKIYCLNSSVGLEAILLGRDVKIFGDSPFKDIPSMDEGTKVKALNFTIFGYLTHRNFLFDSEYYDWRLSCIGNEEEIYKGNMRRMLEEIKKTN